MTAPDRHVQDDVDSTVTRLRAALARERSLVHDRDDVIRQQEILRQEADHRLMNGLQMIASLLRLQSRASTSSEAATQLSDAADRVTTIGQVHHRLHFLDGLKTVAFKKFLEDLCRDFSSIAFSEAVPNSVIAVEGSETRLPAETAIPLAFIVHELIMNAAKHGKGRITVRLGRHQTGGHELSVSSDDSTLPQGFDPAQSKGLGMALIRAFTRQIGGTLQFDRGADNRGTRFAVLFP